MHIALICHQFIQHKGGLERYTVNLARALMEQGHAVHLFAHRFETMPGVVFHHVPRINFSSPLKNLSFACQARRALLGSHFDIVHSMERTFQQDIFRVSDGIHPVLMQQRYPRALFRAYKSITPRRRAIAFLERHIYQQGGCRHIMTNSELIKGHIIRHYGVDETRITVIYNSIDTARFNPGLRRTHRAALRTRMGLGPGTLTLLFAAHNFKLKQLNLVIDALALLPELDCRLLVAGADRIRPYQRQAHKLGLTGRVLFLGSVKEMEDLYAVADIFILPTLYDAFANACAEAMACGLPVITTLTNGAAELINDGENGYHLKTMDPMILARLIQGLTPLLKRTLMGQKAARTAALLTMERHIREVLALYERLQK